MNVKETPSVTDVKNVIVDTLDLNTSAAELDDRLSLYSTTIHLDSLTLLRLLTVAEQAFSCEIDDEAVMSADLVEVGDLVELILGQAGAAR